MGEDALELSAEDLELARKEVKCAFDHGLDIRDFVSQGVDAMMIVRNTSANNYFIPSFILFLFARRATKKVSNLSRIK
jgi:hypothetical protein